MRCTIRFNAARCASIAVESHRVTYGLIRVASGASRKIDTADPADCCRRRIAQVSRAAIRTAAARLFGGGSRLLGCFLRGFPAFGRLNTKPLRESLDPPFCIDQLLTPGEERVAIVADLQVELRLGRPGFPRRTARAAGLDLMVLRVDPFLHSWLLAFRGKGHYSIASARTSRPASMCEPRQRIARALAALSGIRGPHGYSQSTVLFHRCALSAATSDSGREGWPLTPRFCSTWRTFRIPGITVDTAG